MSMRNASLLVRSRSFGPCLEEASAEAPGDLSQDLGSVDGRGSRWGGDAVGRREASPPAPPPRETGDPEGGDPEGGDLEDRRLDERGGGNGGVAGAVEEQAAALVRALGLRGEAH